MIVTPKVNWVLLSRRADMFFFGTNVMVPLGHVAAKDLPAALNILGSDTITFEYRTIAEPKGRERDRVKYTKRLADLGDGWVVGPWGNKVVNGFVFPDIMQCTISRTE